MSECDVTFERYRMYVLMSLNVHSICMYMSGLNWDVLDHLGFPGNLGYDLLGSSGSHLLYTISPDSALD